MDNRQLLLRGLPKIDELLLDEQLVFFMESTPRSVVVDAAREIIDELRREILSGEREDTPEKDELIAEICDRITGKKKRNLRTLINATGVVLHTNLGRSNLCRAAVESVTAVADSYSNLEYDLKRGSPRPAPRSCGEDHCKDHRSGSCHGSQQQCGSHHAVPFRHGLWKGSHHIQRRAGGDRRLLRIPEIMEQSGAHLKEVGTTIRRSRRITERL